jgi:hypothetical protein
MMHEVRDGDGKQRKRATQTTSSGIKTIAENGFERE